MLGITDAYLTLSCWGGGGFSCLLDSMRGWIQSLSHQFMVTGLQNYQNLC